MQTQTIHASSLHSKAHCCTKKLNEWMNEWMNEWNEWMNESINQSINQPDKWSVH